MNKEIAKKLLEQDYKKIVETIRDKNDAGSIIDLIGKEIIYKLLKPKFLIAYLSLYDLENNIWLTTKEDVILFFYAGCQKVIFKDNKKEVIKDDDVKKDWENFSEQLKSNNISHSFRDYIFEFAKNRKSFVIVKNNNYKKIIKNNYPLLVITNDNKGAETLCNELAINIKEKNKLCKILQLLNNHFLKWEYIYYIVSPINRERAVSGISIFTSDIIKEDKLLELMYFLHFVFLQIDFQIIARVIQYHALHSAVAAIMSRNMSHNIGSHILVYLKMEKIIDLFSRIVIKEKKNISQFQEFFEEIGEIQIGRTCDKIETLMSKLSNLEGYLKNLTSQDIRWGILEWIEDTKTFFGYLQHRMDFLAQVSTEWPKWTFSAYLMKDIIKNFLMQRHLLDGIAKSEGLRGFYYEWEEPYKEFLKGKSKLEKNNEKKKEEKEFGRIKIRVFNLSKISDVKYNQLKELWKKKHKSIYDRKKQLNNSRVLLYSSDKDSHINIEKDIPIAIPGGVIGYHALYVIIENIIRNSAKHGYTKKRGDKGALEIVIEFTDDFKEPYNYWRFRIYDNVSKIERRISRNERFRIFDVNEKNKTPEKNLVAFMNECLRHSLIKETGEIDRRHWGMAEMKIAAGYLQVRDVQDIGEKDDNITGSMKDQNGEKEDFIIRAIESPIGTLGFEFKVKKPKEVGIVCYGGNK